MSGGASVVVPVVVHPRASRTRVRGWLGDAVKIDVAAPPVDGEANRALIEYLARGLRIPKASVEILVGEGGRRKVVRLTGVSEAAVAAFLGLPT